MADENNKIDGWLEARHNHAREILRQAEATEKSVAATASHNSDPLWAEELIRCRKSTEAAREALRQFEEEEVPS